MTSQLRLIGDNVTNGTITAEHSDTTYDFYLGPHTNAADRWCASYTATCTNRVNTGWEQSVVGAYYNWYTATAGSGTYSTTSGDAPYSICPKGWKLPRGGTDRATSDLIQLGEVYNATYTKLGDKPFIMNLSGSKTPGVGTFENVGIGGVFWSSTPNGNNGAYYFLAWGPSASQPNTISATAANAVKIYGMTIRCIAR